MEHLSSALDLTSNGNTYRHFDLENGRRVGGEERKGFWQAHEHMRHRDGDQACAEEDRTVALMRHVFLEGTFLQLRAGLAKDFVSHFEHNPAERIRFEPEALAQGLAYFEAVGQLPERAELLYGHITTGRSEEVYYCEEPTCEPASIFKWLGRNPGSKNTLALASPEDGTFSCLKEAFVASIMPTAIATVLRPAALRDVLCGTVDMVTKWATMRNDIAVELLSLLQTDELATILQTTRLLRAEQHFESSSPGTQSVDASPANAQPANIQPAGRGAAGAVEQGGSVRPRKRDILQIKARSQRNIELNEWVLLSTQAEQLRQSRKLVHSISQSSANNTTTVSGSSFPKDTNDHLIAEMHWRQLVAAMTSPPLNCNVRSESVVYVFERLGQDVIRRISQCHAPHDIRWVPYANICRHRKDLKENFSVDADDIELIVKNDHNIGS